MILRGLSEAFLGLSALVNKHYLFVTTNNNLIITTQHANAWGWVELAMGLLVVAAGFALINGSNWARIFAIFFSGIMFLVNMAYLSVFPVWAIVAMVIDLVIIYALVVQGHDS